MKDWRPWERNQFGKAWIKARNAVCTQLDRVHSPLVQLSRDQEPDPSEGLEGHYLAVAASAGDQCSFWTVVGGRQDQPSGARL